MRIAPMLLRADNFTPPSRTPWGGRRIPDHYKRDLGLSPIAGPVGESWEISCEPDFPARAVDTGEPLADLIARDRKAWLGREGADGRAGTALLVKLLDAAQNLSVQIHPSDAYSGLKPGESGKPEAWLVVHAEPACGLYVGFREGVDRTAVEAALRSRADLTPLLYFVPVAPGDFFLIPAGTPHAIGRGVTLVEPQRVLPGRRGATYRYWDWNRTYDKDGREDPRGSARALHVEDALNVTAWDAPREGNLMRVLRRRSDATSVAGLRALAGPGSDLLDSPLAVSLLTGSGEMGLPGLERFTGLTVVQGSVEISMGASAIRVPMGRSAALPASSGPVRLRLEKAGAVLASVVT